MSDTDIRLSRIFAEAADIVREKNSRYQDSWRAQGWLGNLSRILEKAGRLRAMLWVPVSPLLNGEREHPRETAIDMINTLAFMVINMDDGIERGHEERKDVQGQQFGMQDNPSAFLNMGGSGHVPANVVEQTMVQPHVGHLQAPGSETGFASEDDVKPTGKPSPRKRPIKDAPQA